MTKIFKNNNKSTGYQKVMGAGSFDITLDFLPDYITAKFATQGSQGNQHDGKASTLDSLYWELAAVSPTSYTFTVHYNCLYTRSINWLAAKLPVDIMETIALGAK